MDRPSDDQDRSSDPEHLAAVRWAPRVSPAAIRRLYETDARGIVDEEQIDDVGYALYARCQSILRVTEAHQGRVTCPRCERLVDRAPGWIKQDEVVSCGRCGWRVVWRDYLKTYQHKHLVGGGAVQFHRDFVAQFERARTPQQKMLAIDRLIHAFHWELVREPVRAAARELIYARNYKELLTFLDTLTYGENSTSGLREGKDAWDRKVDASPWHVAIGFRATPPTPPAGSRPPSPTSSDPAAPPDS
jgi:hypothetical protein